MFALVRVQASKPWNNILGSDSSFFTENTIGSAVKPAFGSI